MDIFTIDGGTTNTRIAWVSDGTVKEQIKIPCGAGSTAKNGNNQELCRAIGDGIRRMSQLCEVSEIAVSGMCNSELGLYEVPHIIAPADRKALAKSVRTVRLPEVSPHLFHLIPGMKCGMDDLETADMMRGEETEFFGLCKLAEISGEAVMVLPGTHTKLVESDVTGSIISCTTTMSGEMMASLSQHTILQKSLELPFTEEYDAGFLFRGYETAKQFGLNQALFKVRIMRTQFQKTAIEAKSFFCGAVLACDVDLILEKASGKKIAIGGSKPLSGMFSDLLCYASGKSAVVIPPEHTEIASAVGAYEIYRNLQVLS